MRRKAAEAPAGPSPSWQAVIRAIFGDCIGHDHEQVGRCVYCKTCGRRLYQGTVVDPADLAEIRAALEADDE